MDNRQIAQIALCVLLFVCLGGIGSTSPGLGQKNETIVALLHEKADRFDEIFDTMGDVGKLTARFMKLTSIESDAAGRHVYAGESTVITFPDGIIMVVDAGGSPCGPQVANYLKAMGIKEIDIFIASHMHNDHIGGFPYLASEFPIGHVYMNRTRNIQSSDYRNFMAAIIANEIPFSYIAEGDQLSAGAEVEIEVYNPPLDYPEECPANMESHPFHNNSSIMIRISYGNSSMLLAGDIHKEAEKRIINTYGDLIQSDIVKANHHGHATSNINEWISTVDAKIVVMMYESVPDISVYRRYKNNGASTYATAVDGCIKVTTDEKGNIDLTTQFDRLTSVLD